MAKYTLKVHDQCVRVTGDLEMCASDQEDHDAKYHEVDLVMIGEQTQITLLLNRLNAGYDGGVDADDVDLTDDTPIRPTRELEQGDWVVWTTPPGEAREGMFMFIDSEQHGWVRESKDKQSRVPLKQLHYAGALDTLPTRFQKPSIADIPAEAKLQKGDWVGCTTKDGKKHIGKFTHSHPGYGYEVMVKPGNVVCVEKGHIKRIEEPPEIAFKTGDPVCWDNRHGTFDYLSTLGIAYVLDVAENVLEVPLDDLKHYSPTSTEVLKEQIISELQAANASSESPVPYNVLYDRLDGVSLGLFSQVLHEMDYEDDMVSQRYDHELSHSVYWLRPPDDDVYESKAEQYHDELRMKDAILETLKTAGAYGEINIPYSDLKDIVKPESSQVYHEVIHGLLHNGKVLREEGTGTSQSRWSLPSPTLTPETLEYGEHLQWSDEDGVQRGHYRGTQVDAITAAPGHILVYRNRDGRIVDVPLTDVTYADTPMPQTELPKTEFAAGDKVYWITNDKVKHGKFDYMRTRTTAYVFVDGEDEPVEVSLCDLKHDRSVLGTQIRDTVKQAEEEGETPIPFNILFSRVDGCSLSQFTETLHRLMEEDQYILQHVNPSGLVPLTREQADEIASPCGIKYNDYLQWTDGDNEFSGHYRGMTGDKHSAFIYRIDVGEIVKVPMDEITYRTRFKAETPVQERILDALRDAGAYQDQTIGYSDLLEQAKPNGMSYEAYHRELKELLAQDLVIRQDCGLTQDSQWSLPAF